MALELLVPLGVPSVSPGSPLTCDVSQVPRSKKVFDFPLLIKKNIKKMTLELLEN